MLIDAENNHISQREYPQLARVAVNFAPRHGAFLPEYIALSREDAGPLVLDPEMYYDPIPVRVHGKTVPAHLGAREEHEWFSDFLNTPVRLVYQADEDTRLIDANFIVENGSRQVSLADSFQMLVTNLATLEKLNGKLEKPVAMNNFRPNIVVAGAEAEAEFTWRHIRFGTAALELVKPCARCIMTTIDPRTGIKMGDEPLRTLARNYFLSASFGTTKVQGAIFGENALPVNEGAVSVGDSIHVVSTKPDYAFRRPKPRSDGTAPA